MSRACLKVDIIPCQCSELAVAQARIDGELPQVAVLTTVRQDEPGILLTIKWIGLCAVFMQLGNIFKRLIVNELAAVRIAQDLTGQRYIVVNCVNAPPGFLTLITGRIERFAAQ